MSENEMDEKDLKERDFQCYTSWKVPSVIKIAWVALLVWIISYFVLYFWPSFMGWKG